MAIRVLIAITVGTEEMEAITPIDVLRRAGAAVTVAALGADLNVQMARGVVVRADELLSNVQSVDFDMVIVPGGPGANRMRDDPMLIDMLRRQKAAGRWVASICASPVTVLKTHGIIEDEPATCYPGMEGPLTNKSKVSDRVVTSGKIITSRGPGTALEFSLALVRELFGVEKEREVGERLVAQGY